MLNRIIKSQFKSLIVPTIITFILCFMAFVPYCMFTSTSSSAEGTLAGNLLGLGGTGFVLATVMPLCVFSYKYSLAKADFFYQIPFNKKTVRIVRSMIILAVIIGSLVVSFLLGIVIQAIMNQIPAEEGLFKRTYDIGSECIYFPLILLVVIAQYFVSTFFVSKGNCFINSLFLLIGGNIILSLIVLAPMCLISLLGKDLDIENFLYVIGPSGFHSYALMVICYQIKCGLFQGMATIQEFITSEYGATLLVDSGIFAALGIASGVNLFIGKEPSGELCGKAICQDVSQDIIIHGAFAIIGLFVACSGTLGLLLSFTMSFVFYAIAYYMIHSLLNRSFKFTKRVVCIIIPIVSVILILMVTTSIVDNSLGFLTGGLFY